MQCLQKASVCFKKENEALYLKKLDNNHAKMGFGSK